MTHRTKGIIALVAGIMAAIGGIPNGIYTRLTTAPDIATVTTVVVMVVLIICGIYLIMQKEEK